MGPDVCLQAQAPLSSLLKSARTPAMLSQAKNVTLKSQKQSGLTSTWALWPTAANTSAVSVATLYTERKEHLASGRMMMGELPPPAVSPPVKFKLSLLKYYPATTRLN